MTEDSGAPGAMTMVNHERTRLERLTHVLIGVVVLLLIVVVALALALVHQLSESDSLLEIYEDQLIHAKHIDLTHAFEPDSPIWPAFAQPAFSASTASRDMPDFIQKGENFSYARQGFVATAYHLSTDQLGTQLDPPAHWNELGATISDIPPTVAVRPLVVIDVTAKVATNPGYAAQPEDVAAWEKKHGTVPRGSVVMFRTGWSAGWDAYKGGKLPDVFPGVALATLRHLHESRAILFHGHEPLDTDMTPSLEGEAWLMHNDYMQAEGVNNLHLVPEKGALISIGFAKPRGGTGGFARLIAICPPSWPHGETVWSRPGAPLPRQSAPLRRDAAGVLVPTPGATPTTYCAPDSHALGCPLPRSRHTNAEAPRE